MKWDYSQEQTGDVGKDAKQAYDTNHECIFHINISPFFDPVLEIFRSYSAALLRKSFFCKHSSQNAQDVQRGFSGRP